MSERAEGKNVHRMKTIEQAREFESFHESLKYFMGINNFSSLERQTVIHLLNSFYFMGHPLKDESLPEPPKEKE